METLDHKNAREKFASYLAEIGRIKETKSTNDDESKLLEETTKKEISEIKIRLVQIEKLLSNLLKQEQLQKSRQDIHDERKDVTENPDEIELEMRKSESKEHAEIRTLRSEIATIERQLRLLEISAALRVELNDDLKKKRERVNDLIKSVTNTQGTKNNISN
ncbi:MAG: hypothetical protein WD966_03280 [Nitrosopumilaceae archaeon]